MSIRRRELLGAGTLALAAGWVPAGALAAAPKDDIGRLEAELAFVRGFREIKRLQHGWAQLAEAGQWDEMAKLMTRDGAVEDMAGTASGRDDIAAHWRKTMGAGGAPVADRLNVRLFLSPVITIAPDGLSAKGRWHEVAMIGQFGHSAEWSGGISVIDYAVEDGAWRIARIRRHPQFAGPYEKGWHNVAADVPLVPYHYTPDGAGTIVPRAAAPLSSSAAPQARIAALEAEAAILLAAGDVQNLQAAYGFYVDRRMWDDVADLFEPDATLDVAGAGLSRGRAAIRRRLDREGPAGLRSGELNDRPQLMPVVTVAADGQSAHVRGIEVGITGQHGGKTWWSVSIFDNLFVRRGGRWMIRTMRIVPRMRADYDLGWATAATPAPILATPALEPSQLASAAYPQATSPRFAIEPALAPAPSIGPRGGSAARRIEAVRRDIARAAAHDGAENVSNAYGYYIDEFRWNETADLFSRGGWKELSYIGTFVGRDRVRQSMISRYGNAGRSGKSLALHQKTQPYVTPSADGMRAQIRLRLFQFNTALDSDGSYISGIYENQAIVEDGIWKIDGMDLDYIWLASYTGGPAAIQPGATKRFAPPPEVIARYPPDGPLRGETFAPFPAIAPLGFHFANPVSGRAPPLLLAWSDRRRR